MLFWWKRKTVNEERSFEIHFTICVLSFRNRYTFIWKLNEKQMWIECMSRARKIELVNDGRVVNFAFFKPKLSTPKTVSKRHHSLQIYVWHLQNNRHFRRTTKCASYVNRTSWQTCSSHCRSLSISIWCLFFCIFSLFRSEYCVYFLSILTKIHMTHSSTLLFFNKKKKTRK